MGGKGGGGGGGGGGGQGPGKIPKTLISARGRGGRGWIKRGEVGNFPKFN